MAQTTATVDEIIDSLTGHDELAIHAAFGRDITELAQFHRTLFLRAAVATDMSRTSGDSYRVAHKRAMDMRMADVSDYFADAKEDTVPEAPDSESGKDD